MLQKARVGITLPVGSTLARAMISPMASEHETHCGVKKQFSGGPSTLQKEQHYAMSLQR
jgi:hypothetical protein